MSVVKKTLETIIDFCGIEFKWCLTNLCLWKGTRSTVHHLITQSTMTMFGNSFKMFAGQFFMFLM